MGTPFNWADDHRYHHEYSDTDKDLHSPWIVNKITFKSFIEAHHPQYWLNSSNTSERRFKYLKIPDLKAKKHFLFLENHLNEVHAILFSSLINFLLGGISGILAYFAALCISTNSIFSVNSFLHCCG